MIAQLAALELDAEGPGAALSAAASPTPGPADGSAERGAQIVSWEEDKAKKARLRRLKKREEEISLRLESVAAGRRALEETMARPDTYSDGARMKKVMEQMQSLEAEAAALNEEWLAVAEELAEAEG